MRFLLAVLPVVFAVPAGAAPAAHAPCITQAQTWQSVELTCPLEGPASRRYVFAARFSGSHDDTTLSMAPTLDGAPLACAPGSKTESSGEDGEVVLECRFVMDRAAAGRALRVRVQWYHATYEGHRWDAPDVAP